MSSKIIIVNNDLVYAEVISKILVDAGYEVGIFQYAIDYLNKISENPCDLIISAHTFKNMDGESFFKQVRDFYTFIPFIFIFESRDVDLIASLLKYNNCDVLVKPVVTEELLARVKVLLNPLESMNSNEEATIKDLTLCNRTKLVKRGNKNVTLTPKEFMLLEYLVVNKNTVLSRNAILNKVWGTTDVSDRVVDVYIGYLREKIDSNTDEKLIETVPGFGYVIKD